MRLLILLSLLSACTISTRLSGPRLEREKVKEGFVVITHARLTRKDRGIFFDRTRAVFAHLPVVPGYLGGSFRRELFGDEAWTLTIWESERAMRDFFYSAAHLDAMYMGSDALKEMRSVAFIEKDLRRLSWTEILPRLEGVPFRKGHRR